MFYVVFTSRDGEHENMNFDNFEAAHTFFNECVNNPDVVSCLFGQVLSFYKEEE